jgi:hypothetical protein
VLFFLKAQQKLSSIYPIELKDSVADANDKLVIKSFVAFLSAVPNITMTFLRYI